MSERNAFSVSLTRKQQRWALLYLLLTIWLLPTTLTFSLELLFPGISLALLNFVWFGVNFLCVAVLFRKFWTASIERLGHDPVSLWIVVCVGLVAYFVLTSGLSLALIWLRPDFFNVNDSAISGLFSQDFALMAVGTVLLVPVAEEFLYRGFVFGSLYPKNRVLAYLVSTTLFCAIHILGYLGIYDPVTLLLCFCQYIPAGLCLAWAYRTADNLFAPIFMHAIINALGIFAQR